MKALLRGMGLVLVCIASPASAKLDGAQAPGQSLAYLPARGQCSSMLGLEKLKVEEDRKTNVLRYFNDNSPETQSMMMNYVELVGWLEGFATFRNAVDLNKGGTGNIYKNTTMLQWMTWIFSYCRAHPSETIVEAAGAFATALGAH
jgi:hypothetical protein